MSFRIFATLGPAAVLLALANAPVHAQGAAPGSTSPTSSTPAPEAKPAPAAPQAAAPVPAADPVVATVDGDPIHASDLRDAMSTLPPAARQVPPQTLYPMVLDQMIDVRALAIAARRSGLDKDPAVQRQIATATEHALETAYLHKQLDSQISDEAVRARFDRDMAGHAGPVEVHARHILLADEATAKKVIADLKKGGDFAALSAQYSKDPGASKQGGDLGFFKEGDMVPEFAKAAFAMKDNEISSTPVHTQFGWHVIQVLGRREAPAPDFATAKDELRQRMVQEGIKVAVADARAKVAVEQFNLDGSPKRATDMAEPPAAK